MFLVGEQYGWVTQLSSEVWVRPGRVPPAWWGQGGVGCWGAGVLLVIVPTAPWSVLDELVNPYCFKDSSLEWAQNCFSLTDKALPEKYLFCRLRDIWEESPAPVQLGDT